MNNRRIVVTGCLLFCAAALSGCSDQLAVVPVSGKVLYNHKPLEFGGIMFQPVGGGPFARGIIQADGSFHLTTYKKDDGAIPGKHLVRITCFEEQRGASSEPPGEGLSQSLIPTRYNNPRSSGLEADVTADSAPFTFELTE